MHLDEARILARIDRLQRERIAPAAFRELAALTVSAWQVPGDGEPVPVADALAAEHTPVTLPQRWGRAWSTWWFRLEGTMPKGSGCGPMLLEADLGFVDDWPGNQCEGMLYAADGTALKAINSRNRRYRLQAEAGADLRFHLEAAANPDMMAGGTTPTELGDRLTAGPEPVYELRTARIVERDDDVWGLWHDIDVLRGLAPELPADSTRRARILVGLDDAADALDLRDVAGTAASARAVLAPLLAAPADASAQQITAIGHAHIDSAWLWPVRETIRKVARTFANVDALMEEYPEFTFTATSAQQYAWLKASRPDVYERVRQRIAEGRWHPSGGMWVESDATMPGGEAMIRQFTQGIRFFRDEFGVRSRTLWLPDSFGYSAALPQIAVHLGLEYFLTQKISWSKTNRYPHTTFWWEGIDGSRLLAHYPPVDCYDSMLTADEIATAERGHRDKARTGHQVIPFGYGDGGGGPTATMVERARRRRDLEGSAQITLGDPDGFFDAAREDYGALAPTYRGELYLEFHRGIFTSQLEMKQGNRACEHALRTVELVWAMVTARGRGTLDQERLDRLWQRTLLLQFHDILPGSSIAWVHREARDDHAVILAACDEFVEEGLQLLGDSTTRGVLNAAGHDRIAVVTVEGEPRPVQVPGSFLGALPAQQPEGLDPVHSSTDGDQIVLDNGLVRVHVGPDGTLTSVRDLLHDRELIPAGASANQLQMFEDLPNEFDAWDLDRHYRGNARPDLVGTPTRCELTESGPWRAVITIERMLGGSPITQTITLDAGSRRVDFGIDVDWRERETLLKAAFPLAIRARETLAETQFGHVARPLHENTSWEFARFETVMHRWVLAAEPGCGAALITDSTYGYDALPWPGQNAAATTGTLLRLSLMRGPNWPDPRADLSRRRLCYSLLVDADPEAATRAGQELNLPLRLLEQAPAQPASLLSLDGHGITIEAVLPAHDGSGDLVARLYETTGGTSNARLHLHGGAQWIREVDPLEEQVPAPLINLPEPTQTAVEMNPDAPAAPSAATRGPITVVDLELCPFQILTLRWRPEVPA